MRWHWIRARTFVHATEDEARVLHALLWALRLDEDPKGSDRVDRLKLKGHYGNTILVLESTLKSAPAIEAALAPMWADAQLVAALRQSLVQRLDDDGVLHIRLDKQAAVQGRRELQSGSDAIVVTAKVAPEPGQSAYQALAKFLDSLA